MQRLHRRSDFPHDFDGNVGLRVRHPDLARLFERMIGREGRDDATGNALGVVEILPDLGDVAVLHRHQPSPHDESPLQSVQLVDVDRRAQAIDGDGERQRYGSLRGRDRDHEHRKDLAVDRLGRLDEASEADQVQVDGIEHQLDSH